jgi:DNA-binding NarL/FixJ family response regulator
MIKVILVDDHEIFRIGVRLSLAQKYPELSIVGEAESGRELFRLLETTAADIVLLDILLPDTNGTEVARRLRRDYPALKILAISAENSAEVVQAMLDIGINGFISKRRGAADEIAAAIHSIIDGMEYYGRDIADIIYRVYVAVKKTDTASSEFTEREREIIELCRLGLTSKQIGERLFISPRTVDNHKNHIFEKLDLHNMREVVHFAVKNGIITT